MQRTGNGSSIMPFSEVASSENTWKIYLQAHLSFFGSSGSHLDPMPGTCWPSSLQVFDGSFLPPHSICVGMLAAAGVFHAWIGNPSCTCASISLAHLLSAHLPHFHTRCWILGVRPPCLTNIGRQEMLFSDWLDGRSSTCRPSIFGELGLGCPQVHLHLEGATARAKIVLLSECLSKEQGASAHFGVHILRSSADPRFSYFARRGFS